MSLGQIGANIVLLVAAIVFVILATNRLERDYCWPKDEVRYAHKLSVRRWLWVGAIACGITPAINLFITAIIG